MRVSSVCAQVPTFGVSAEFRYGIGVAPHRRALDRSLAAAGPEDDHVVLRAQIGRLRESASDRCSRTGLVESNACRHQPSVCVLVH